MGLCYKLTCECGAEHPVETSQAGRSITCTCGRNLPIPSMLKMKRLPIWGTAAEESMPAVPAEVAAPVQTDTPQTAAAQSPVPLVSRRSLFQAKKRGLLIAGVIGFIFFSFLSIRTAVHRPQPIDVLRIQRFYMDGGKVIARDSNPIEDSDAFFFVTPDSNYVIIDNGIIDQMTPFYAMEYFDYLKTGLDLSDNFYDKFDSLQARWKLTIIFEGVLALFSAAAAGVSFLFRDEKTVGVQRGSAWKS